MKFYDHYAQATHIVGYLAFSSHLGIVEAGKVIGDKMFGGLVFDGLEESYCEEVPCIWVQKKKKILELEIYIQESRSNDELLGNVFLLKIKSPHLDQGESCPVNLSYYLQTLFLNFFPKGNGVLEIVEYDD